MGTRNALGAHTRAVQVACGIAVATLTAWADETVAMLDENFGNEDLNRCDALVANRGAP